MATVFRLENGKKVPVKFVPIPGAKGHVKLEGSLDTSPIDKKKVKVNNARKIKAMRDE